ncbi:uncharacterized protein BN751_02108 [Coprococcus eutactus CAG:665]|nr:uncharacterized protein BN751_02108 [Coprococcus eutactus CAG:665]
MFERNSKYDILKNEPYSTFIKKFNKLTSITNEKIRMKINSVDKDKRYGFANGFNLDYVYTKSFALDFKYIMYVDTEYIWRQTFCIIHTISYKFEEDDYYDMMMDTISDIQKRNGYFYISSMVKECDVNCSINNKNIVNITYTVTCEKENAKEVCLQLISNDIALFTRDF